MKVMSPFWYMNSAKLAYANIEYSSSSPYDCNSKRGCTERSFFLFETVKIVAERNGHYF